MNRIIKYIETHDPPGWWPLAVMVFWAIVLTLVVAIK